MTPSSARSLARCRVFSRSASLGAVVVGALALVGWTLDFALLKSVLSRAVPMNPATAVSFILAGLALWLLQSTDTSARPYRTGRGIGLLVAVAGLTKLGEHVFGFDTNFDQFLFRAQVGNNVISPNAALGLVLVGSSLWLLDVETRRGGRPAEAFALGGALLSLVALLGYTFGAEALYAVGTFYPIALPTAVTLQLLSLGVLCARPDRGLMKTCTGDDAGGVVVRRLLPVTIATLCLAGSLQSAGERRGLYTAELGNALQTSTSVVILSFLIWRNAGALRRVDEKRQLAEAELRRSKEHLGVTLQSIGDAVLATDRAGRVTGMNPVAERLTGWRQADALGRPIGEVFRIVNEFTREPSAIPVDEVLSTGEIHALAYYTVLIARDGSECAIADSAAPIRDLDGHILGVVLVFRDVTTDRAAEQLLRASEARYRTLFESIDEGFCVVQMIFDDEDKPVDYRFMEINPSFEKQTGFQDALGKTMRELAPELEAHWFETFGRIAVTGEPARFQNRAEQLRRTYDVYAFRFGDPADRQVAILFNDITSSKYAEGEIAQLNESLERRVQERTAGLEEAGERLRESERRFRALIENSADGIAVIDASNTILYVSPSVLAVEGYAPEELIGRSGFENTHPDDLPLIHEKVATLLAQPGRPVPVLWRRKHKDGRWRWLEGIAVNLLDDPAIGGIVTNYRDVTERMQAEERIRAQLDELLRWQSVMVKREDRMVQLKTEVNELLHRQGRPIRYPGWTLP